MKPLLIALALARALDAATSCHTLARGGVEINPVLSWANTCPAQVGAQAGLWSGQAAIATWLARHDRATVAKVLLSVSLGLEAGAVTFNLTWGRP